MTAKLRSMAAEALAGLRVLECGDFVSAPYATAMLGHLGADVVKVEPPEGDSVRRRGPYPGGQDNPETGGLHLYLDQAKRGVVLDLDTEAGKLALARLAAKADLLLASGPADLLLGRGLTYDALKGYNPSIVVATITPYGIDVADSTTPMRELCDLAGSGWLSMSPGALEDPGLPPLKPFGQQAHFQAGIHAAVAALGALAARDADGMGQHVDISVQAAIASEIESGLTHFTYGNRVASRLGNRIFGPWGMVEVADGLLFVLTVTEADWERLVAFLGHPDWADNPLFADRLLRAEYNDALLALIGTELAGRTVNDTYVALQETRIPSAPISQMADLLAHPHLLQREFFVEADHPRAGKWKFPGAQWKFSATPWQPGRRAPLLGEHTDEVLREWTDEDSSPGSGRSNGPPAPEQPTASVQMLTPGKEEPKRLLPLEGVRIADFTWVWAGPMATMQLAYLGADVVKIESSSRLDTVRAAPPLWEGGKNPDRSAYFNQYNQDKRSLTLNLKHPAAMEIALEVVRKSDVVADNFSAGAMERLGLGFETLRKVRSDLIQISMSSHGQTGPIARYVAYGPTQVPMIGLAALTGYPGGGPREAGISYGDPNAGLHAAVALLAALAHRRRTGEGQYIDMSQWEAALPLVVEGLLTHQMTGTQPTRMGNRDEFEAPQGVFRCLGDDEWVAISCWSDEEWYRLADRIDRPDLAADPALGSRLGRKARESELESAIANWTSQRTRQQAETELSAVRVAARAVATTAEVVHDPVLAAREFWVELPHPSVGTLRHSGIPSRFSGTPLSVRRPAPALGQHTSEVLRGLLGMSDSEIEKLREGGALS